MTFYSQNFNLQKFNDYFLSLKETLPNTTILVYLSHAANPLLKTGSLNYDDYKWLRKQFPVNMNTFNPLTDDDIICLYQKYLVPDEQEYHNLMKLRNILIFSYLIKGFTGHKIIQMTICNYADLNLSDYNICFKSLMRDYLKYRQIYAYQNNKVLFIGYNNKQITKMGLYKVIKQYHTFNVKIKTSLFIL